jgi:serine protease inhibitor
MIVDENGVEAAAAQAAGPHKEITLDHPFACYVSQPSTGIIMYAGTVGPDAIDEYEANH